MVWDQTPQHDSQWAGIRLTASKIGRSTQTLRHRIRQLERDAAPVAAAKHGRPVVIVLSVKEYEHLKALESAGKS